jgi:hypothetical protein
MGFVGVGIQRPPLAVATGRINRRIATLTGALRANTTPNAIPNTNSGRHNRKKRNAKNISGAAHVICSAG